MRQHTDSPLLLLKRTTLALACLCTFSAGCASAPKPEDVIHESQRGAVYLEPLSNRYLQAAHPISLPTDTISRVLRGVLVQGSQTAIETMFESQEAGRRAFSDEEVTFLIPHVVTALSRAKPTQQVHFRVTHQPRGPGKLFSMSETGGAAVGSSDMPRYGQQFETSSGTLYVYGLSLYLTVTEYRQKPSRPDDINMPNRRLPESDNLDRLEFLFTPKTALRPESYQEPGFLGEPSLTPIIIDYELLAKLPAPKPPASQPISRPAPPTPAPPSAQPLPSSSGPGKSVETELEALKEELKTIRKQLAEQEAERQKQPAKKKTKPAPVPPQPSP